MVYTKISHSHPVNLNIKKSLDIDQGIGNDVLFELIQPAVNIKTSSGSGIKTRWAIANLYHRVWHTHIPCIMRDNINGDHTNGDHTNIFNGYQHNIDRFRFKDLLLDVYTNHYFTNLLKPLIKKPTIRGQLDSMGDPCLQVIPMGLSRTPSIPQLQELTNYNNNYPLLATTPVVEPRNDICFFQWGLLEVLLEVHLYYTLIN